MSFTSVVDSTEIGQERKIKERIKWVKSQKTIFVSDIRLYKQDDEFFRITKNN